MCLFVYLSTYLSIYLAIHLSILLLVISIPSGRLRVSLQVMEIKAADDAGSNADSCHVTSSADIHAAKTIVEGMHHANTLLAVALSGVQ